MWSKITNVLKNKPISEEPEPSSSQGEVMSRVYERHPNLSVFHNSPDTAPPTPSPPPSPSKKRGMFKRLSKLPPRDDNDSSSLRSSSSMNGPSKKVRSFQSKFGTTSQLSLTSSDTKPEMTRRSSSDMLRTSIDTVDTIPHSSPTIKPVKFRRPSLDMLRFTQESSPLESARGPQSAPPLEDDLGCTPISPSADGRFGSVRSILRHPRTPGTGQNVRFFSRDAYKVISPEQSMNAGYQPSIPPPGSVHNDQQSLHERPGGPSEESNTAPSSGFTTNRKASRPSVSEVFSPMPDAGLPPTAQEQAKYISSTNQLLPLPPPDFSDLFNVSQTLDIPKVPPGLGFDVQEPLLDSAMSLDMSLTNQDESISPPASSTPFRDKGKGKAKEISMPPSDEGAVPISPPAQIGEPHSEGKSARLPLHDRSQSFSFGQTVFHSITHGAPSPDVSLDTSRVFSAADLKPSLLDNDIFPARTSSSMFSRGRAMSDTAFQSMMRSPTKPPEADMNDESSSGLVVYSGVTPDPPDPFRANATTYYTPQTMIPVTPPQGAPKHTRKTSKEENIIFSLQTQLTLQAELCGQYEADLRARDELVDILGKKLSEFDKEEAKRKSVLRTWKKKVQELEKTCRYLEEEVEGSRHDSMERSIMDEASGEALRMLHRQIAVLEKEKSEWTRQEAVLREEVATLEGLMKERSEDIMSLKDMLWTRDESERELKEGIREAKEQMEMMGNLSVVIDEDELKKRVLEKDLKSEEERDRHRAAEFGWNKERGDLVARVQVLEGEKAALEAELEVVNQRLATKDKEHAVLKDELNAQWEHTEKTSEKIEGLDKKNADLEKERDALKLGVEELERKLATMDADLKESEDRKLEVEAELQEVWNYKEELEKEREQLEDHSAELANAIQERDDRITELDQERQFCQDNVARLEEKLRQRDQEVREASERMMQRETEAEELQEQMSKLTREHARAVDGQTRALNEVSTREGETKIQLEALVRQQAEGEVEMKTSKDKINALKDEVERLRRQIHDLQQESADKEVKLVQLAKQRAEDREDLAGLNMALDSKQQELALIKRKVGVRGTGGGTPAPPVRISRRDSSAFATPTVQERPSSVLSDASSTASKSRKLSTGETPVSAIKIPALGKSGRVNGVTTTMTGMAKRIEGSMGPPPVVKRASVATPTPVTRVSSLSRSSLPSVKPATTTAAAAAPHRRVSSMEQTPSSSMKTKNMRQSITSPTPSDKGEKENVDLTSRRRAVLATPI